MRYSDISRFRRPDRAVLSPSEREVIEFLSERSRAREDARGRVESMLDRAGPKGAQAEMLEEARRMGGATA